MMHLPDESEISHASKPYKSLVWSKLHTAILVELSSERIWFSLGVKADDGFCEPEDPSTIVLDSHVAGCRERG